MNFHSNQNSRIQWNSQVICEMKPRVTTKKVWLQERNTNTQMPDKVIPIYH